MQVKEDEMTSACSTHGEKKNGPRILVGKPEKKRHECVGGRIILRWILDTITQPLTEMSTRNL
jgi:hypothetical protein